MEASLKCQDRLGAGSLNQNTTCAICLEDKKYIVMPCCGKEGATVGFCHNCIQTLCEDASSAKCPNCRAHIRSDSGCVFIVPERMLCRVCCCPSIIVQKGMCEACVLGKYHRLHYECSECSCIQAIPHAMWRYQDSPQHFGNFLWDCDHCGGQSVWRTVAEDIRKIPDGEAASAWPRLLMQDIRRRQRIEGAPSNMSKRKFRDRVFHWVRGHPGRVHPGMPAH